MQEFQYRRGEAFVGILNRMKNYARWAWEWYKLNPYRNTLVAALLLLLLFRGPADTPAEEKPLAQAPTVQVITIPVILPIIKKSEAYKEIEQVNLPSLLKEFDDLSAEKFAMSFDEAALQRSNAIVDRLRDIRTALRHQNIDAELDPKLVLNQKQKDFVREQADELQVLSRQADEVVKKLFAEESRAEEIDKRRSEIAKRVEEVAPKLPDLFQKWAAKGLGKDHRARVVVYEQAWRSYNRTLRLIPIQDRLDNKLQSKRAADEP